MRHVISFVRSGTRATVRPVSAMDASRCAAGVSSNREPRADLPSTASEPAPEVSLPARAARPPGQIRVMILRIVAVLSAMRTAKAPTRCVPRRARACWGAEEAHCPIAAYELARRARPGPRPAAP